MAKGKKHVRYGGNAQSKKNEIERLKEIAAKNKEKTQKEIQQKLIEKMGEEDAKLFMSQEEILRREKQALKKEEKLKELEEDIKKAEENYQSRIQNVKDQETQISEKVAELQSQQKELKAKKNTIEKMESELLNVERSLIERENNAKNEFTKQNKQALEILRKQQAELQKSIEKLESQRVSEKANLTVEIQKLRKQKIAVLEKEITALYESRKKEMEVNLAQIEKSRKEHAEYEIRLLNDQRCDLEKSQSTLNKLKIELNERKRKLAKEAEDLRVEKRMFAEEKKTNQKIIEQSIENAVDDFRSDLKFSQSSLQHYKNKLQSYEARILEYEQLERETDGKNVEDLLLINEALKEDISRLRKERAELPNGALFLEFKSKALAYDKLQRELNETRMELFDLQNEKQQWMKTTNLLEIEREKCLYLEKRREALEATIEKYGEEVNRFKSLYDQPKKKAARLEAIKEPTLDKEALAELNISETEWLDRIYQNCIDSGIRFNRRLLYSFHTALKTADWSPITVLAGVSGTGKSLLPEYYCRYGGLYFKSMAVQPDWDSPQALFGYFNSVDNRFNATTLLRAMVQFNTSDEERIKDSNLADTLFLVLLDEMNLAHVELYFSDMLSKLERRRNSDDDVFVEIDLGAGMDKYQLELNHNILWVGTMNEDETTKSLSDKVLDRGNLISFPRPKEFISRTKVVSMKAAPMLRKKVWDGWIDASVVEDKNYRKMIFKYKEGLETVNESMEFAGRALGHRVWQSIENYMANHPFVVQAFSKDVFDQNECDKCLTEAFEEALVHKVMPKLRGIETDGETKVRCIDRIKDVLFGSKGLAPGLAEDFDSAINTAYETFLWKSAKYLENRE